LTTVACEDIIVFRNHLGKPVESGSLLNTIANFKVRISYLHLVNK